MGGAGGDLKTKLEERLLEALARRDALDEDAPPAKDAAERSVRGPEDEAARLDEMLAEAKAKAADTAKHESAAAVAEKDGEYGKFMHRLSDELARWNEREGGRRRARVGGRRRGAGSGEASGGVPRAATADVESVAATEKGVVLGKEEGVGGRRRGVVEIRRARREGGGRGR